MLSKIRNIYAEGANESFLGDDSLVGFLIGVPFALPLIRLMQRLNLRIHPNVITLASFLFVISAAYFFFNNKLVIGAGCYIVYFIMDAVDGKWARLTGKTSKLGERLDYYLGALGNLALYFGLWYSQYYLPGIWIIGAVIIGVHYFNAVAQWLLVKDPQYKTIFKRVASYYSLQEEAFGTFVFATIFNIVTILFPILVALQLTSLLILYFRQAERPDMIKRLKKQVLKL